MGLGSIGSMAKGMASSALSGLMSGASGGGVTPSFEIKLNSKKFKFANTESALTDVNVNYTVFDSAAGVCTIIIKSTAREDVAYGDVSFQIGSKIELSMGYDGQNGKIFSGYVVGSQGSIEYANGLTDATKILVGRNICMDSKWLLMSNKKMNTHDTCKSYSAVVKDTLKGNMNIKVGTVDVKGEPKSKKSSPGDRVACQEIETDFDFLKGLAKETGCLFYADEDDKLNFISLDSSKKPKGLIKTIKKDMVESCMNETKSFSVPSKVCVIGLDATDMSKCVKGESKDSTPIGTGKSVNNFAKNTSKTSVKVINVNCPISKEEANIKSQAIKNIYDINAFQARITLKTCCPGFKLGQKIKTKGIDNIPDNEYIITKIEHIYSSQSSPETYVTTVTLNSTRSTVVSSNKKLKF